VPVATVTKSNLYKDSVALMRVADRILALPGVSRATLVMGTPANKGILADAGLLVPGLSGAGPTDLLIVVDAASADEAAFALSEAERLLSQASSEGGAGAAAAGAEPMHAPRSIAQGIARTPDCGLVQICVPGAYAGAEAMKALRNGCHVFLFSDNVPLAEERALKLLAARKGLLVMGPDCGTAILNGVPLGFANAVRRGPVGLVGASGTGLQALSVQIDLLGSGVSHAIGTGSRDVSDDIGGITMLQALELLGRDQATQVIALVAKPPSAGVAEKVLASLLAIGKPAVVLFIGQAVSAQSNIHPAASLQEAALKAVELAGGAPAAEKDRMPMRPTFVASQKYIRGIYSGGTFCLEAQSIWRSMGVPSWSNAPIDPGRKLIDSKVSAEHSAIDLGEDEFTVGRPHPMIDPGARIERLRREAADRAVAIIVLDVVLGYGAHPDPAGALVPAIREARLAAAREGRALAILAFVCGTEQDPQKRSDQVAKLRDAGALVFGSSSEAARMAALLSGAAAPNAG
jgi:succinyl-CoA synthetase alpha subunit